MTVKESRPYIERCWERRLAERAILGFCGVELPWVKATQEKAGHASLRCQGIGEACGGVFIKQCTIDLIDEAALRMACRTCPD